METPLDEAMKQITELEKLSDLLVEQINLNKGMIADYKVYAQFQSDEIERLQKELKFYKVLNKALEQTQFIRNDN